MIFRILWLGCHQIEYSLLRLRGIWRVVTYMVSWVLRVFFIRDVVSDKFPSVFGTGSTNFACFVLVSTAAKRNSVFHEGPLFCNVHLFASMTVVSMRINISYGIMTHKLTERTQRVLSRMSLHRQWESIGPKYMVSYLKLLLTI